MRTIAQQYHQTKRQLERTKPRSERRTILTRRLVDLMVRQLKIESRKKA